MLKPVFALVLAAAFVEFAGCSKSTPTAPTRTAIVTVSYSPSPALWSAGPGAGAACAASPNVWKFTVTYTETGGVAATLSSVVATLDGVAQPSVAVNLAVPASGSLVNNTEICFQTSTQHTFQYAFSGTDSQGKAISFNGPQLVLLAK